MVLVQKLIKSVFHLLFLSQKWCRTVAIYIKKIPELFPYNPVISGLKNDRIPGFWDHGIPGCNP